MPRIKICCISSIEEAKTAVGYGASALGLVSDMPSGPGVIPESLIRSIAATIPPAVGAFLLTCLADAEAIIAQQRRYCTNTIQICDRVPLESYELLRESLPGISIVQVIHVVGEESVEEAQRIAPQVDAILLDSGNHSLVVKELGGTGRIHDWTLSRKIRAGVGVPIFLAGGLHAENVAQAIEQVRPFGIDVCSGVRTNDKLDPVKLAAFFAAVQGANRIRSGESGE